MNALPEYVMECPLCGGKGVREQLYNMGCGAGMCRMEGPCEMCKGASYIYKATVKPVSQSVINQIRRNEDREATP